MTHHSSVEQLSIYLDDRLDDSERRRLEGHLADCEECRRRLAGMRHVVRGSRGWKEPHHHHTWPSRWGKKSGSRSGAKGLSRGWSIDWAR